MGGSRAEREITGRGVEVGGAEVGVGDVRLPPQATSHTPTIKVPIQITVRISDLRFRAIGFGLGSLLGKGIVGQAVEQQSASAVLEGNPRSPQLGVKADPVCGD